LINEIAKLPEISFIGDITLDDIRAEMVSDYQDKFQEINGAAVTLKEGEPVSLMLYACAVQIYQMYLNTDIAGKMNFLKYAYGDYLDNLGALKGIERKGESSAVCTVRFSLAAVRAAVTSIPAGTRVTTSGAEVYFETDEYAEIPIGATYVDALCTSQTAGQEWNGIEAGELNVLVDPIPYIASVYNVSATSGGLDKESDEALAERIYLASGNFSVAGPEIAYIYLTREAYSGVEDVRVTSPSECEVEIFVIGKNGEFFSQDVLQVIEDYITASERKPMTDHVTVSSPTALPYDIEFTYYINRSEVSSVAQIQAAVNAAVDQYIAWQSGAIGRDVEPGKLVEYVMAAGAKRVTVTYPTYVATTNAQVPQLGTKAVNYGGLEDD